MTDEIRRPGAIAKRTDSNRLLARGKGDNAKLGPLLGLKDQPLLVYVGL
jgi:hypothetical protein